MRSLVLALTTLAFAAAAGATTVGPYTLDKAGRCHAANGRLVAQRLCEAGVFQRCRDSRGRMTRCPPGCSPNNMSRCRGFRPV